MVNEIYVVRKLLTQGRTAAICRYRFRGSHAHGPVQAMRYCSLAALAMSLTTVPCAADIQNNLFRDAYECPNRGPSSVCVYGTIPGGMQVTILAKGWKSLAQPKETFSTEKEDFQTSIKTSTRLQVATSPPKGAFMIAVLAPAEAIKELPLEEIRDDALAEKISQHVKTTDGLNLAPGIKVLRTRLLRASSDILLSETFLARPDDVEPLEKELSTGCADCENVPMLVGHDLSDLFKEVRSTKVNVESTCGGIEFAFALFDRTYLLSHAFTCESDSFSATLVHDLSGIRPTLVFEFSGGF